MRECLALVDEGVVGLEELDLNVKWGIGYKLAVIPPMQLLDMAGHGHLHRRGELPQPGPVQRAEVSPTIRDLVAKGRLGMKTKGGLFDYTDEQVGELRAQRAAARSRCARRSRPVARGGGCMKIYLLDLGSLVIDRSDVLWHIDVGTPVRFPVYGVYIDHPEGKFIFDTGYDLDHVNKVLPFELPEQTPEQTLPAQLALCGIEPEDDRLRHQLPLPLRPRRRQQVPHQRDAADQQARAALRPRAGAVRAAGYSDRRLDYAGAQGRVPRGRHRDRQGAQTLFETPGPHHRPLLAAGRARGPRGR